MVIYNHKAVKSLLTAPFRDMISFIIFYYDDDQTCRGNFKEGNVQQKQNTTKMETEVKQSSY